MINNYIIGASGLIGSALFKFFKDNNIEVTGTYCKNPVEGLIKFDLKNKNSFEKFKHVKENDIIYFMSAYSNPSWIAKNKSEAKKLNYEYTIEFIKYLTPKKPRFIFMSSVEVFDGQKGNYDENALPNPLNYYGMLKFRIEKYLEKNFLNHTTVRTGWNIGLNNKSRCVVQLTYESLLKKNAMMALDNFFSIAYVEDTVETLFRLAKNPKIKKINICSDGVVNRVELANLIIQYSKNSKLMAFKKCNFSEINYNEPRGRINNLNNLFSKKEMNMNYKNYKEIIIEKIKFLDDNFRLGKN